MRWDERFKKKSATDYMSDYDAWANKLQTLQQSFQSGRIPNLPALEEASSARIGELLSPPETFGDVSREAAELASARGVSASPAAFGTGLRMTDEERLRRIALGQDMLSAAVSRNPIAQLPDVSSFVLSPYQEESLQIARREQQLREAQARQAALEGRSVTSVGSPNFASALSVFDREPQYTSWSTLYPGADTTSTSGTMTPDIASNLSDYFNWD